MKKFHHIEFLFGACCCFFSSTHIISTKQQRLKWSRSSDPKAEHMHQYFTTTYFQIEKNETQKRKILKPNQKYVTHRQHSAAGRSLLLSEVSAGQEKLRPYFQKSWNNFRAQTAISAGQAQPMYLNTCFFSHLFPCLERKAASTRPEQVLRGPLQAHSPQDAMAAITHVLPCASFSPLGTHSKPSA